MPGSFENAVQKPARPVIVMAIESVAIKPEAPPVAIFHTVIIACALLPLAPPFRRKTLRPLCPRDAMRNLPPAKETRRPFRHFGHGFHRLWHGKKPQGARQAPAQHSGPVLSYMCGPARHSGRFAVKGRNHPHRIFRNVASSRLHPEKTLRTETIAHPIHKTLQRFPLPPAAFKALLCRQQRIDSETGKRDRFNAETGIEIIADGFKLLAEEARNMVRLMRGKARARAKLRHLPVRAEKLKLH